MERILAEIQGLRWDLRSGIRETLMELGEIWRNGRSVTLDARDLVQHFLPDNVVQVEGVEDEEVEQEGGSETEKDADMADETQQ